MPRGRAYWTQLFAALLGWMELGPKGRLCSEARVSPILKRVVLGTLSVPYWFS